MKYSELYGQRIDSNEIYNYVALTTCQALFQTFLYTNSLKFSTTLWDRNYYYSHFLGRNEV